MKRLTLILGLLLALLFLAGSLVMAEETAVFTVSWWTVDNGGGSSNNSVYAISGTAGQPDAHGQSSGGIFAVSGGFWYAPAPPAVPTPDRLFLPLVVSGN